MAVTEKILVVFGVGKNLQLVVKVSGKTERLRYQLNLEADRPYFGRHEIAGPEPRRFDLPRPDGVYRIVVVGGSTVFGFPYPPELAFPRQLQVLLNQQKNGQKFEVLNAGIVAINSFSVADVVNQVPVMEPDLIIVHTGHNEFYGPTGVESTAAVSPQALYPFVVKVRRTRLFQLISSCFQTKPQTHEHLLESLPQSIDIPLSGPAFRRAERYYRHNLELITNSANSAGIPIVLTTVASNLSGYSPASFHVPEQLGTEQRDRWRTLFDRGRQLTVAKSWAEALECLERAAGISSQSSLLHYRMGQCLAALGRHSKARAAFELARDHDGCRFRAPGSFGGIVRDVVKRSDRDDVFLVDIAERLVLETGPETPGSNLFLEHVHYNLVGHRRVALILSHFVQTQILHRRWDESRIPPDSKLDALLGLLQEDRISGQSYALQVMDVFPMTKTFDVSVHKEQILERIKHEFDALNTERRQVFENISMNDMATRLVEVLSDHYRQAGQLKEEIIYRRKDVIRRPWNSETHFRLARCLAEVNGYHDEATQQCRTTLLLSPEHSQARRLLTKLQADSSARQKLDGHPN